MSTLRELKGRIGSVASSEKITGAMKMISSAKMHKAEQNLSRLVPFRNQLQGIMGNLMQTDAEYTSELTDVRDVKTVTIVVLGSDEGLCGAYNINIFKGLLRHINELRKANPSVMINVVPVGKKIVKASAVVAGDGVSVERIEASPKSGIDGIRRLVDTLKADYVGGKTDRVEVVSMKFLSAGKQRCCQCRQNPSAKPMARQTVRIFSNPTPTGSITLFCRSTFCRLCRKCLGRTPPQSRQRA